jgi:hypothetical protein
LERDIDNLRDRIRDAKSELQDEIQSVSEDLETHKQNQADRLENIHDSLERIAIKDLMWEGIALGWLFVGPLMASEPAFVAGWIQLLLGT